MSKWVEFREVVFKGKTRRWEVVTKEGGIVIGRIQWHGAWRRYTLAPAFPTVWEEQCLRDVAEFIETQTREHRAGWNAVSA